MCLSDSGMAEAKLQRDGWTKKAIPRASAVSVSIGSITRLDSWDVLKKIHRQKRLLNMWDQKQINLGLYLYTSDSLTPSHSWSSSIFTVY